MPAGVLPSDGLDWKANQDWNKTLMDCTPKRFGANMRGNAQVRWLIAALLTWFISTIISPATCCGGLLVYIDDTSTKGIDVLIADGKKAGETVEWLTNDKQWIQMTTTLSDSNVEYGDGAIGLTTEADGGTWALLKSFLPRYRLDPSLSAKMFEDPKTGASGVTIRVEATASGDSKEEGELKVWATQTFRNALPLGVLRVDGMAKTSDNVKGSQLFFTGAADPDGFEFSTSVGITGSPTFGKDLDGLESYSYSNQLNLSFTDVPIYSLTAGITAALSAGEKFSSSLNVHAVVPEPASLMVWGIAGVGLVSWRRIARRREMGSRGPGG